MANANRRSILKTLLGLASALTLSLAGAQSPKEATKIEMPLAQKYVKAILAADMATLNKLEDDTMKKKMTREIIAGANHQITQGVGAFKIYGTPREGRPVLGHDVVYIPCIFERGKLDGKVIFDVSHKVAGCFMVAPGSP